MSLTAASTEIYAVRHVTSYQYVVVDVLRFRCATRQHLFLSQLV